VNALRWAWLALAVVAVLLIAQETRYVVHATTPVTVWDRWTHRFCMIQPDHGWVCGVALR
jgi:hypothetical protein